MKKKIVALLLTVIMAVSVVSVLAACKEPTVDVEAAIAAASKMSLAELEAAAQKEYEGRWKAGKAKGWEFNADSLTSGVKKVLEGFKKKYDWLSENAAYNSKKGSEYQPVLNAAADAGTYVADFVMIQDALFVNSLVEKKFLLTYTPSGSDFTIADSDKSPLVGVTFNKVFMFNKVGKDANYLANVWQLTGADGATLQGRKNVTFQNPQKEDINLSFLVMLTSADSCAKLTSAYESYFGVAYDGTADSYENIGYKFVAEFLANISYHDSDTTQAKKLSDAEYLNADKISFIGVAKIKDYQTAQKEAGKEAEVKDKTNSLYPANAIGAAGLNIDVEGFCGFTYNMWVLIPKTAHLPYTACLFIRYLMSQEGFDAGWKGNNGYYSANTKVTNDSAWDKTLVEWKAVTIGENVAWLKTSQPTVKQFVIAELAKKK